MKKTHRKNQIWDFFKKYYKYGATVFWINIVIVCVLAPIGAILGLNIQKYTVNAILDGNQFSDIFICIIFLVLLQCLLSFFINAFQDFFIDIKSQKINYLLSREIYEECLKTDYKNFDNSDFYSCYSWTIREYSQKCRDAMALIVRIFGSFAGALTLIVTFFSLDWIMFIITVITMMLNTFLGLILSKTKYIKKEEAILDGRKLNYISRIFYQDELIKDIKASASGQKILDFYDASSNAIIDISKKYCKKTFYIGILSKCITYISVGCMYVYLTYQALNGKIEIGEFVTFIAASNMLKNYLVSIFDFFKVAKEYPLYAKRINEFFSADKAIEGSVDSSSKSYKLSSERGFSVSFENVSFHYGEKNKFSLSNINLKIKSGQKIAIVGDNGSGKTTLVKLLLRLYDPVDGKITVNDVDIRDLNIKEYRQNIGVSMQEAPVLAFSIKDNLTTYSKNNIDNSLRITGFEKTMIRRNATMETLVTKEFDTNGLVLSGGEKRLLSLAKVIGGSFGIIVLDEPSSALDPNVEARIMSQVLDKNNTNTVFIISHRLINIIDADTIFVMSNGSIAESGSHMELMMQKGKYYEMFIKQTKTNDLQT